MSDDDLGPAKTFLDYNGRAVVFRDGPSIAMRRPDNRHTLDMDRPWGFGRTLLADPCGTILGLSLEEGRYNATEADKAERAKRRKIKAEMAAEEYDEKRRK